MRLVRLSEFGVCIAGNTRRLFSTVSARMSKLFVTSFDEPMNFINNSRCSPIDIDEKIENIEPSTGKLLHQLPCSGSKTVDMAVEAARKAQPSWAAMHVQERCVILRRAADLIRQDLEQIAQLEVRDCGKPIWEARGDIEFVCDSLEYYGCAAVEAMRGSYLPQRGEAYALLCRGPLGVCVGIGAWNYPMSTCVWKTAPALATGNALIYKPSQFTPATAVTMGEALAKAGLPAGVYNVVQGAASTGRHLCQHADVAKVSFTGSVLTGISIIKDSASTMKRVTMELGGKSPLIIFEDADLKNAVKGALMANFYSQGQVCSNGTRVFVHSTIKKEFTEALLAATSRLKVDNPHLETTTVGATIHRAHAEKVMGFIERAQAEGARVLYGGERVTLGGDLAGGYYLRPCILDCSSDQLEVVREEVFGSVLCLLEFNDEADVIHRANSTRYGLAAGLFTKDLARAHRVIGKLQAGSCSVNTFNSQPCGVPFGGYKMSGYGRENGVEAFDSYTQLKTVMVETGDADAGLLYQE